MADSFQIERTLNFAPQAHGRKVTAAEPESVHVPGRIPRISRIMALAIRFEELLQSGEVESQAKLAGMFMVSRARITQIMHFLYLAPDIQEEILFLPRVMKGRDLIGEHDVRSMLRELDWEMQREMWGNLQNQL